MTYLGFPVTLGFMEETILKGGAPYVHRGIDLGSFTGDRLVIGGTLVAITGESGRTEGPHTHVQAGYDVDAQNVINPAPYIGKLGIVYKTGYASQWGNYVCIDVGGIYVYYCHLQEIKVKPGQKIGATVNKEQALQISLYGRLGNNESLEKANANGEYDANQIVANPSYAGALLKQLYNEHEIDRWKAGHYDELAEAIVYLKKQADELAQRPTTAQLKLLQDGLAACVENSRILEQRQTADKEAGESFMRRLGQFIKRFLP